MANNHLRYIGACIRLKVYSDEWVENAFNTGRLSRQRILSSALDYLEATVYHIFAFVIIIFENEMDFYPV